MDYLAFGFSDGVGSRSSLSLQNGDQPIERRTSRLWINKAPSPAKSLFSRTLPKTSPLSTPGTSQEAHPPTPPLTPPLTPPEGTQTKPQVVVGRWLPPYGQEAPL